MSFEKNVGTLFVVLCLICCIQSVFASGYVGTDEVRSQTGGIIFSLSNSTVVSVFNQSGICLQGVCHSSWEDLLHNTLLTGTTQAKEIIFDTNYTTNSTTPGTVAWDATDQTLAIRMLGGNVNLDLGQEQLIRVVNKESFDLIDGHVVYLYGVQGQRPAIKLAIGNDSNISHAVIGVTTEPIAKNQEGYVTITGIVHDIDTSSFSDGDDLYLSCNESGNLTNIKPSYPCHIIPIAKVLYASSTHGKILVNIQPETDVNSVYGINDSGVAYYNFDGKNFNGTGNVTTQGTIMSLNSGTFTGGRMYYTNISPLKPSGWNYCKTITASNGGLQPNANLTNMTILVRTTSDADLVAHALSNGNDIIFASASGTMYNFEKVSYASGTGIWYVQIPNIVYNGGATFNMCYGNPSSPGYSTSAAWDTNIYSRVYHMRSGNLSKDATANGYNLTLNNITTNANGVLGGGINFNAANKWATSTATGLPTGNQKWGVSLYETTYDYGNFMTMFSFGNTTHLIRSAAFGNYHYDYNATNSILGTFLGSYYTPKWVSATYNGSLLTHYSNGVNNGAYNNLILKLGAGPMYIGRAVDNSWTTNTYGHIVEEMRVYTANANLTDSWVKFEANNIVNPDNQLTFSVEFTSGDSYTSYVDNAIIFYNNAVKVLSVSSSQAVLYENLIGKSISATALNISATNANQCVFTNGNNYMISSSSCTFDGTNLGISGSVTGSSANFNGYVASGQTGITNNSRYSCTLPEGCGPPTCLDPGNNCASFNNNGPSCTDTGYCGYTDTSTCNDNGNSCSTYMTPYECSNDAKCSLTDRSSCVDNGNLCSTYTDGNSCNGDSQCLWGDTGSYCSDPSYTTYSDCVNNAADWTWVGTCAQNYDCTTTTDQYTCDYYTNGYCHWNMDFDCNQGYSCAQGNQNDCEAVGSYGGWCTWNNAGTCYGTYDCNQPTQTDCLAQPVCQWFDPFSLYKNKVDCETNLYTWSAGCDAWALDTHTNGLLTG